MGDRGTVMPAVAALFLGGVLVAGLAIDLGRWSSTWREAAFAADAGAEAGAAIIDPEAAYRGELAVEPVMARSRAAEAAIGARPREGRTVSVAADAGEVCVEVTQPFRPSLMRLAGIGNLRVRAGACASPAQG